MIAGELITSATVRTVRVAGMPRILPTVVDPVSTGPDRRRSDNVHLLATRCSRERVVDVTRRRDSQRVNPLTTFVRSLGNDGALANARAVLDARVREDWLVQGLARRLERVERLVVRGASPAAPGTSVAAVA